MSEAASVQLNDRTVKILVLIAGGAGAIFVNRFIHGLLLSAPMVIQFQTAGFAVVMSLGMAFVYAIWLGWLMKTRVLADWAAIGYFLFYGLPIVYFLISSMLTVEGDQIGPFPLFRDSGWLFLSHMFLPMIGFPVGAWLRARRSH